MAEPFCMLFLGAIGPRALPWADLLRRFAAEDSGRPVAYSLKYRPGKPVGLRTL